VSTLVAVVVGALVVYVVLAQLAALLGLGG
jgi:hypothetical protein